MTIDPLNTPGAKPISDAGRPERWDGGSAPEMVPAYDGTPSAQDNEKKKNNPSEDSVPLITQNMSPDALQKHFNARVKDDRKEFKDIEACIQKLKDLLSPLQEAGLDIGLSALDYQEKSRLFPGSDKETKHRASLRNDFYKGIQLSLNIYDRSYLIMPIDDNSFYMLSGIINKSFHKSPDPMISDQENGSTFMFDEKDNIELFLNTVFSTASVCAAAQEVKEGLKTSTENTPKKAVSVIPKK